MVCRRYPSEQEVKGSKPSPVTGRGDPICLFSVRVENHLIIKIKPIHITGREGSYVCFL
jgi:hypothetical protein